MRRQPHTWIEYQYHIKGDNDNKKMWIKDEYRIFQNANGGYFASVLNEYFDENYNTFKEAEEAINKFENDN
jgi:hypothetical protein